MVYSSSGFAFALALLLSALPCMANTKKNKNKNKNRRTTATCQSPQSLSTGTCPAVVLPRRIRIVYTDPDATDISSDEDDDNNEAVLRKRLVSRVVFIPPEYRFPLMSKTTSPATTSLGKEPRKPPAKRRENQPGFQDDDETEDACSLPDVYLDFDGSDSSEPGLDFNGWDSPAFPEEPLDAVTCNSLIPMHGQDPFSLNTFSPCSVLEIRSSGVVTDSEPCSTAWLLAQDDLTNYDDLFVPENCSTLAPVLSPLDLFNEGPHFQDVDFDQATDWWLPVTG